nr:unnamed protein product [Callosobruchus chinensis]
MKTTLAFLFLVAFLQSCSSNKRCPSDFCDNKKLNCPSVLCPTESILIERVPEACICCESCYTRLNEGDNCEHIENGHCDDGLKCVNSICTKD